MMDLESVGFVIDDVSIITTTSTATATCVDPEVNSVTSFNNIHSFLLHHKYPNGLNLNQKRTLRKAAANFTLIGDKLYYTGKNKKEKRLVIFDDEGKKRIFRDCHDSAAGGHWGQKKTLEKIESLFFWRGMVKDIIGWIQKCETCLQKEDKRSFISKRFRSNDSNEDTLTMELPAMDVRNHPPLSLIEKAKSTCKQLEKMLNQLQENEKEVISMSDKADQDIDDVLDHILGQIIKMVSKKRRDMKEQVEKKKTQSLSVLNHSRKQLELKLKSSRKLVADLEVASEDNRSWSPMMTRTGDLSNSLPEIPLKEEVGGLWTLFKIKKTYEEVGHIIRNCGDVTGQPAFRVSRILEVPASLRLGFEALVAGDIADQIGPTKLRLFCRNHNTSSQDDQINVNDLINYTDGQLIPFSFSSSSCECYITGLEPHQTYSICISHLQEGMEEWSPWSFPFIGSTSFPRYAWDSSNAAWMLSGNQDVATKFDNVDPSPTALYSPVLLSSSAQFFPGCKINFTVLEASRIMDEDGFALIEQWVQGGTLCQEGTVFLNGQGQLFIDGKFHSHLTEPFRSGTNLIFDCFPLLNQSEDGIVKLRITVSCHENCQTFEWTLRSQISNVYFGMQFNNQGTRVKVE